jgi:hypothetical protein
MAVPTPRELELAAQLALLAKERDAAMERCAAAEGLAQGTGKISTPTYRRTIRIQRGLLNRKPVPYWLYSNHSNAWLYSRQWVFFTERLSLITLMMGFLHRTSVPNGTILGSPENHPV